MRRRRLLERLEERVLRAFGEGVGIADDDHAPPALEGPVAAVRRGPRAPASTLIVAGVVGRQRDDVDVHVAGDALARPARAAGIAVDRRLGSSAACARACATRHFPTPAGPAKSSAGGSEPRLSARRRAGPAGAVCPMTSRNGIGGGSYRGRRVAGRRSLGLLVGLVRPAEDAAPEAALLLRLSAPGRGHLPAPAAPARPVAASGACSSARATSAARCSADLRALVAAEPAGRAGRSSDRPTCRWQCLLGLGAAHEVLGADHRPVRLVARRRRATGTASQPPAGPLARQPADLHRHDVRAARTSGSGLSPLVAAFMNSAHSGTATSPA